MSYVLMIQTTGADAVQNGQPFDKYRDAIDDRNWIFGHVHNVEKAWLVKDGKIVGAVLRR